MNNSLLWLAAFIVLVLTVLYWVFHPYRCPKCRSKMDDYYDNRGRSWKVCPKCKYQIQVGEEDC